MRDTETQAYSAEYIADCFEKERSRAGRFRRPLSLLFLSIGNDAPKQEKARDTLVAAALPEIVDAIRKGIRGSDIIGRVSPDRFCILLPETDSFGSVLTLGRLRKKLHETGISRQIGTKSALAQFLASATYPLDGKDFGELSRVGEDRCRRQRSGPLHRLHLMDKSFQDAFDSLVGEPEPSALLRMDEDVDLFAGIRNDLGRNRHFSLKRETYLRLVEAVAQDVSSLGNSRGLVIAAGPRPEIFRQIFLAFGSSISAKRKIYIVGRPGRGRFEGNGLLHVPAGDGFLKEREVLLYLKENGAYGIFAAGREDAMYGFSTADEWLVEAMIGKLKEACSMHGSF